MRIISPISRSFARRCRPYRQPAPGVGPCNAPVLAAASRAGADAILDKFAFVLRDRPFPDMFLERLIEPSPFCFGFGSKIASGLLCLVSERDAWFPHPLSKVSKWKGRSTTPPAAWSACALRQPLGLKRGVGRTSGLRLMPWWGPMPSMGLKPG